MIDYLKILITAGDGGDGAISFRREKYVPKGGPDGGDGGDGGSVIIRAVSQLSTLNHLQGKLKIQAENGSPGGARKKHGVNGKDAVLEVPVGTRVVAVEENLVAQFGERPFTRKDANFFFKSQEYTDTFQAGERNFDQNGAKRDQERKLYPVPNLLPAEFGQLNNTGRVIAELNKVGQEMLLCAGGFGGRGNTHFKSSVQTTPRLSELGSVGERLVVALELRLLADLGLVGQPNVGKSTLLSVLSAAKPKIASYPFTTLEPNLGVLRGSDLVIADIPGLVAGAHEGKGLGVGFLKHIAHCKGLCFVISVDENLITKLSDGEYALGWNDLRSQLEMLETELQYSFKEAINKPRVVAITKADLYPDGFINYLHEQVAEHYKKTQIFIVSSATNYGIKELSNALQILK